ICEAIRVESRAFAAHLHVTTLFPALCRGWSGLTCIARTGPVNRLPTTMTSLLDQSALMNLAERLVAAARRAGADQADAVDMPSVAVLEKRARQAEQAALAVPGVAKSGGASASAGVGGMVLVTSHGFRGATIGSRHSIAMSAIAGSGTAMEQDYDYSSTLHA